MKRAAHSKAESRLINVYLPLSILPSLNATIQRLDTDRSKFIRAAIREKLERSGIKVG